MGKPRPVRTQIGNLSIRRTQPKKRFVEIDVDHVVAGDSEHFFREVGDRLSEVYRVVVDDQDKTLLRIYGKLGVWYTRSQLLRLGRKYCDLAREMADHLPEKVIRSIAKSRSRHNASELIEQANGS